MPDNKDVKPADNKPADNKPAAPEVVEPTPTGEPKATVTAVPANQRRGHAESKDETVPGGMTVQRINGGRHYQVQNADGEPIPGKVFDPMKNEIVNG